METFASTILYVRALLATYRPDRSETTASQIIVGKQFLRCFLLSMLGYRKGDLNPRSSTAGGP